MQKLQILNSKEIKKIKEILIKQFSYSLTEDYAYLENDKERIFIINKDVAKIDLNNLKIDKLGLYLGELKGESFRLSKEGAQLLAQEARENKKEVSNLIALDEEEIKKYFSGEDLHKDLGENSRFVILTYKREVLGCSKYKEGIILNYLPKIHRGEVIV